MFTEYFIFTIILLAQILIGIFAWVQKDKLPRKYSHYLSEMIIPAKVLENYSKIYRNVGLKVNASIKEPAYALTEFVLIGKRFMYSPDLYTNYYMLFQLELSKKQNEQVRFLSIYQNILFVIQILVFAASFFFPDTLSKILILTAISIQVFLVLISFMGYIAFNFILEEVHEVAKDLLNFDEVEVARAESLKSELAYRIFEYPFETIWRLYQFFRP